MLEALTESRYLDGLTRRLKHKWAGSLPSSEVDDCVAQAVDAACDTAFKRQKIHNLGAWLWKTATNIAEHMWHEEYAPRQDFSDDMLVGEVKETISDRLRRDELEEACRKKAIRVARELLPRVGEGQILDVMELVIDAAANENSRSACVFNRRITRNHGRCGSITCFEGADAAQPPGGTGRRGDADRPSGNRHRV